jgi:hypothetical protein
MTAADPDHDPENLTRFWQVTRAIETAAGLETAAAAARAASAGSGPMAGAIRNTPWMPFNLFDFAALLFEALPLIPDSGRFLDIGAGPGSKMIIARDVYGLDAHGIEISGELAAIGRALGLSLQTADADDWAGYGKFDCVWLNRPLRDRETERSLEERVWREMAPGAVIICANTETRPPQSWIIVNDSWEDLRRGAWVKPYTDNPG